MMPKSDATSLSESNLTSNDSDSWEDSEIGDEERNNFPESYRLENISEIDSGPEPFEDGDDDGDGLQKAGLGRSVQRRDGDVTDQTFMLYTPDEEQTVVRTFDRRLVLFVALLYMLSFLDRSSKFRILGPRVR